MSNVPEYRINEELVKRYRQGDGEALKVLIKRFHPQLKAKILYYTKDRGSVEDLVQESWLVIINKLADMQFQIGFEPWALSIARNKAIDWVRGRQRERAKEEQIKLELNTEQDRAASEELSKDQMINRLREAIVLLPNTQRMILTLFYLDGHSLKEISKILDISTGTVKSRLFHAREQLKELIQSKS